MSDDGIPRCDMIPRCLHFCQITDGAWMVRLTPHLDARPRLIYDFYRHAWMSYMVDKPPTEDAILQVGVRPWELKEHRPTMTATRAAYKPYST